MTQYFAGYYNNRPAVYADDGFGYVRLFIKDRRTIQAAHNIAKLWNASERKKNPGKRAGATHEKSEPVKKN